MKIMKKISVLAVAVLMAANLFCLPSFAAAEPAANENLVKNGSFEAGLDGWDVPDGKNHTIVSDAVDGEKALQFGTRPISEINQTLIQQEIILPEAGTYHFSAYLKNLYGNHTANAAVVFGNGFENTKETTFELERYYQQFHMVFECSEPSTILLQVYTPYYDARLLADDIRIEKIGGIPDHSVPGNLIQNGGFEKGMTSWEYPFSPNNNMIIQAVSHWGSRCAYIMGDTPDGYDSLTQTFNIPAAGTYELVAFVGNPSPSPATITITTDDGIFTKEIVNTSDTLFSKVTLRFAVDGATNAKLAFRYQDSENNGNAIAIDDVSIAPAIDNLVQNGDFEADYDHWTQAEKPVNYPGISTGISILRNHDKVSGLVNIIGTKDDFIIKQELSIPTAGKYDLSFDIASPIDDCAPLIVTIETSTGVQQRSIVPPFLLMQSFEWGDSWGRACFTFDLPADDHAILKFVFSEDKNIGVLDNVSLIKTPEETPEPPITDNLLQNSSFEDGMTNWSHPVYPNDATITTAQWHTGNQAAKFDFPLHELANQSYLSQSISAGAGTYSGSVYIKTEEANGPGVFLMLEARDKVGKLLAASASAAVADSNGGWVQTDAVLIAPQGTVTVTAKIMGNYSMGIYYVDDVSLSEHS